MQKASLRKKKGALDRLLNLLNNPHNIDGYSLAQLQDLRNDLTLIINEFPDAAEIELVKHMYRSLDNTINAEIVIRRVVMDVEREARGLIKKTVRQVVREIEAEKAEAPREFCIVCNKREKHFGDYCKRCVP